MSRPFAGIPGSDAADPELTPRDLEYHAGAGVIVECLEYRERVCPDTAAAF